MLRFGAGDRLTRLGQRLLGPQMLKAARQLRLTVVGGKLLQIRQGKAAMASGVSIKGTCPSSAQRRSVVLCTPKNSDALVREIHCSVSGR